MSYLAPTPWTPQALEAKALQAGMMSTLCTTDDPRVFSSDGERGVRLSELQLFAIGAAAVERQRAERLLAALAEARRWLGDGDLADGIAREIWTPRYAQAVASIDATLAECRQP